MTTSICKSCGGTGVGEASGPPPSRRERETTIRIPPPPEPDEKTRAIQHAADAIRRMGTTGEALHHYEGGDEQRAHLAQAAGAAKRSAEEVAKIVAKWCVEAHQPAEIASEPTDQECGAAITDPGDDGSGWG